MLYMLVVAHVWKDEGVDGRKRVVHERGCSSTVVDSKIVGETLERQHGGRAT